MPTFTHRLLLAGLLLPALLVGQPTYRNTTTPKALKPYKEGEQHAANQDYALAQGFFEKAVNIDPFFVDAWLQLGYVEAELKNWPASELAFEKAVVLDTAYALEGFFKAAQAEWEQAKFDEAAKHAGDYIALGKANDPFYYMAQNLVRNARFVQQAMANPVPFEPRNLGPGVNTANDEYFPSLTADGESLVFTRRLPVSSFGDNEDFFQSAFTNGQWTTAQPIQEINTPDNEGAQALSPDGTWLVFTACNRRGDGSQGSCDLYWSQLKREGWSKPQPFSSAINSEHWESQPSISADGRSIAFSSNRPGGFGGKDLWITSRGDDGKWSKPQNLGPVINTGGFELLPYLHPDGQTMYFASDSLPGMGGLDLFVSRKKPDGSWGEPTNLGYPINTTGNEVALTVSLDGHTAYYASNREGSLGGLDLYAFDMPVAARPLPATYARVVVKDALSGQLLSARAEVVDLGTAQTLVTASTRKNGSALVCLPAGRRYMLNVSRPGYVFYSENFNLTGDAGLDEPFQVTAELLPVPAEDKPESAGKPVVLRNVFFDTGSATLKPESRTELDRLMRLLQEQPGMRIQINGHTDSQGDDALNLSLSEDRAKAVYEYLVQKGISADRLRYKGFGESRPVDSNDTEAGRSRNRRTEFVIW